MDVFHRGPGQEPGVGELDVLVALLYRPFCQDTKGHTHLFLRPPILELQIKKIQINSPEVQVSMCTKKMNIGGHRLREHISPQIKTSPEHLNSKACQTYC